MSSVSCFFHLLFTKASQRESEKEARCFNIIVGSLEKRTTVIFRFFGALKAFLCVTGVQERSLVLLCSHHVLGTVALERRCKSQLSITCCLYLLITDEERVKPGKTEGNHSV